MARHYYTLYDTLLVLNLGYTKGKGMLGLHTKILVNGWWTHHNTIKCFFIKLVNNRLNRLVDLYFPNFLLWINNKLLCINVSYCKLFGRKLFFLRKLVTIFSINCSNAFSKCFWSCFSYFMWISDKFLTTYLHLFCSQHFHKYGYLNTHL